MRMTIQSEKKGGTRFARPDGRPLVLSVRPSHAPAPPNLSLPFYSLSLCLWDRDSRDIGESRCEREEISPKRKERVTGGCVDKPQERVTSRLSRSEPARKYSVTFDDYAERKTIVVKRGQQIRQLIRLVARSARLEFRASRTCAVCRMAAARI